MGDMSNMVQQLSAETTPEIIYPDSDGQPMADNTKQYEWIVKIKENLEILFAFEMMYLLQVIYFGILSREVSKLVKHLMLWWCLVDQK